MNVAIVDILSNSRPDTFSFILLVNHERSWSRSVIAWMGEEVGQSEKMVDCERGLGKVRGHDVFLNFTPDLVSQRCFLFVLVG